MKSKCKEDISKEKYIIHKEQSNFYQYDKET